MFYPSPVLLKRTAVRLKGFKPPAIKLLNETYDFVHPSALTPRMPTPHWEPKSGLSTHQAWQNLNMPILDLLRHPRGGNLAVDFQGTGSGHGTQNHQLEPIHRLVGTAKVWSDRETKAVEDGKRALEEMAVPGLVLKKQRRREMPYSIPGPHLAEAKNESKTNPPRYKPPSTLYWQHSVYSYNKGTTIPLPVTSQNSSKIVRAFLNRVPTDVDFRDVLPQLATPKSRHKSVLRAYLADKSSPRTNLHPSLLGKLSTRNKQEFAHPWKTIRQNLPEITYKHYPNGEVGIQAFVYDRRIEALKQRREKLAKEILGMVVAGKLLDKTDAEDDLIKAVSAKLA